MHARPKYQVFISSTYEDLREERKEVTWAILKDRHIPIGMENFAAMDDRGWQAIKALIDRTDYYVLIVAGRYGSEESGKSWTEREYDYAREKKIPVLAFVRDDSSIAKADMDGNQKGLKQFIAKIGSFHHYQKWQQTDDLVASVTASLRQQIDSDVEAGRERPGWYRGTELPSKAALEEFARLSAENQQLRAAAADHGASEVKREGPVLSIECEMRSFDAYITLFNCGKRKAVNLHLEPVPLGQTVIEFEDVSDLEPGKRSYLMPKSDDEFRRSWFDVFLLWWGETNPEHLAGMDLHISYSDGASGYRLRTSGSAQESDKRLEWRVVVSAVVVVWKSFERLRLDANPGLAGVPGISTGNRREG